MDNTHDHVDTIILECPIAGFGVTVLGHYLPDTSPSDGDDDNDNPAN